MARPRVRTATLTRVEAEEIRELFGTMTHAYRRLVPTGATVMTWSVFRTVAAGLPSRPGAVTQLRDIVRDWKRLNLRQR